MFYFAGTVLNNTRLEQVYIIFIKHYTLLVETTTVCFILSNRQVVTYLNRILFAFVYRILFK